ncbi:Hypothetical protein NGAL_HAMBI1146_59690 [Neorhizobium galegae bv. officinalis]|nr:Hypothetical protein NGAL_HAMBI1146_59690 [Neorhizobium galegae bv. officinalis]
MQRSESEYRLTALGKLGAALFVLPTPIAAYFAIPPKPETGPLQESLRQAGRIAEAWQPPLTLLILLATASLIGLVLLLIGREIITTTREL